MVLDITAPNFVTTLSSGYTIAQLFTFVKDGFANCGWGTPIAEQDAATKIVVYEIDFNSALLAQVRIVCEITGTAPGFTVRLRLHIPANYNIATFSFISNTGANANSGSVVNLNNTNTLRVYAIPLPEELTGLAFVQGTVYAGTQGVSYPATWESWWDETTWCRVMLIFGTNTFVHCYPNPLGTASSTVVTSRVGISTNSTRNPVDNKAYVVPSPYITTQTWGISGQFNSAIGISNNSGYLTNDISQVTAGLDEWWNLSVGDNGIVIQIDL